MDLVFQSSPHVPEEPAVGGPEAGDGVPVGSRMCNGCNGSVTAMDHGTGLNVKQKSLTLSLLLLADPTVVLLLALTLRTVLDP